MAKKRPEATEMPKERAFLVGVEIKNENQNLSLQESLDELAFLCETAGLVVVGTAVQRLDQPHPETLIGSGKVEEVKALAEEFLAEVIVFDTELSPRHLRELETRFGSKMRVLDRTALILDIFALHASTRDGILQVELAQNEYRLPRLTRAWTHLARQAGGASGRSGSAGGVGLRGPGETQLEIDRREIHRRISFLKAEIEKLRKHRERHRAQRKKTRIPTISLVGYTNAGKSSLLNKLTNSDVYVANQLFATLDPTTRRVDLPGGEAVLFTDTVGFIQKLPTQLVAAFRATLEEINEADLLIHVLDITHPNAYAQYQAVNQTLSQIEASDIPIIIALNKIDLLKDPLTAEELEKYPNSIPISAKTGQGIDHLLAAIKKFLFETFIPLHVKLPYKEGYLISLFHDSGQVEVISHQHGGVVMKGSIPARYHNLYQAYDVKLIPAKDDASEVALVDEPDEGNL